ncbi:MAG: hypothetical protein Q8926_12065, partial [Bacteroidota bacterium]|nr:hypothetical protein [Bacteroidota bacterium]
GKGMARSFTRGERPSVDARGTLAETATKAISDRRIAIQGSKWGETLSIRMQSKPASQPDGGASVCAARRH